MTKSLTEFLADREQEIKEQMTALRKELREIRIAKKAIAPQDDAKTADVQPRPRVRTRNPRHTLKEMICAVLKDRPNGADHNEIMSLIKERFDEDVLRTSLSPQLSRLKNEDDKIALQDGGNWVLKEYASNEQRSNEEENEEEAEGYKERPTEVNAPVGSIFD